MRFAFLKGDFFKNSLVVITGTILAQSINLVSLPFLARLYTPVDFGLLALFMAVSSIVATGITLRYEAHIVVAESDGEAQGLAKLALFFGLILGVGISILLWLTPASVKAMIGISDVEALIPFVGLSGFMGAVIAVTSSWLNRIKDYKKIAYSKVVQALGLIIPSFALYYYPIGYSGLITAQIISLVITALFLSLVLFLTLTIKQCQVLSSVARQHQAAPKFLLPTALLDVITMQLPVILITAWFGSGMAGQFSIAWKVLAMPSALVGVAVGQVFFQQFSKYWQENRTAAKKLLIKTWHILALAGFLPMLAFLFWGESIFVFVFGNEWAESGKIASVIVLMLYVKFVSSPTSSSYITLGLQSYSLIFGLSVLLYRPICFFIGYVYDSIYVGLIILVIIEIAQISIYQMIAFRKASQ